MFELQNGSRTIAGGQVLDAGFGLFRIPILYGLAQDFRRTLFDLILVKGHKDYSDLAIYFVAIYKNNMYRATEMELDLEICRAAAQRLAVLYEVPFGGKDRGRFRISMKLMCEMTGRRRLYEDDIKAIGRELLELGYVLIDMETYLCVLDQRTLANYRRVNGEHLHEGSGTATAKRNPPRRGRLQ